MFAFCWNLDLEMSGKVIFSVNQSTPVEIRISTKKYPGTFLVEPVSTSSTSLNQISINTPLREREDRVLARPKITVFRAGRAARVGRERASDHVDTKRKKKVWRVAECQQKGRGRKRALSR